VLKVLYVEDLIPVQTLVCAVLARSSAYAVKVCGTAAEALTLAEAYAPDIFLLDVGLPDFDGIELLTRLRAIERFRATPAIFLTSDVARITPAVLSATGALGALEKDLHSMRLPEALARFCPAAPGSVAATA
jgi:CheY-like chemotaxis protein